MNIKNVLNKILDFFSNKIFYLQGKGWGSGTVDKEFFAALSLLSNKNLQLCIDIGGNKGLYSERIIKKNPNCSVVIFEPALSNSKILIEKFKKYSNVIIEQSAVSYINENAVLFSDKDGSGLASLTKRRLGHLGIDFSNTENIKTIKFEDYWKEKLSSRNIDICKIDIEGHEMDALKGLGSAINYIKIIQFEFGGCNIDTRTFFQDFWYFFKENEFELYRISPLGLIKISEYKETEEFFSTTNYLAKRKQQKSKNICNE